MVVSLGNAKESLARGIQPLTATLLGMKERTGKPVFEEAASYLSDISRRLDEVELDQDYGNGIRPSF